MLNSKASIPFAILSENICVEDVVLLSLSVLASFNQEIIFKIIWEFSDINTHDIYFTQRLIFVQNKNKVVGLMPILTIKYLVETRNHQMFLLANF